MKILLEEMWNTTKSTCLCTLVHLLKKRWFGWLPKYNSEIYLCFSPDSLHNSGFPCRNSSVGRALDWRSKGPWFDPGFRQINRSSFQCRKLEVLIFSQSFLPHPNSSYPRDTDDRNVDVWLQSYQQPLTPWHGGTSGYNNLPGKHNDSQNSNRPIIS